jgi:hypothetical protein
MTIKIKEKKAIYVNIVYAKRHDIDKYFTPLRQCLDPEYYKCNSRMCFNSYVES